MLDGWREKLLRILQAGCQHPKEVVIPNVVPGLETHGFAVSWCKLCGAYKLTLQKRVVYGDRESQEGKWTSFPWVRPH